MVGAARFIDRPTYRALLLRRTTKQLDDSLIPETERVYPALGAKWHGQKLAWTFPSGAKVRLGHMEHETSKSIYDGAEYQFVGFDELTHFYRSQYVFMFSRLRSAHGIPTFMRATTNPGGIGHCVPFGEVMTPVGWRDIREMQVGDAVYSVDATGRLFETVVEQVHRAQYDGPMVYVEAGGLSMVCTPRHRVAKVGGTRRARSSAFSLVPFDELPGQATVLRSVSWAGDPLPDFVLPMVPRPKRGTRNKQPTRLSGRDFAALFGWFITEGCTVWRPRTATATGAGAGYWFQIAQMKAHGRAEIRALLLRCGFLFKEDAAGFTVHSKDWAAYFRQFGKSRDKWIPREIREASVDDLDALFRAMMGGDGHWTSTTAGQFYTSSRRLVDDAADVAMKLGYVVRVTSRQRHNRRGLAYELSVHRPKSGGTELLTGHHSYRVSTHTKRRSSITRETFSGEVFCIGVPRTHSFVLRQNGSCWVSGNSWVLERWAPWLYPPGEESYEGPRAGPGEKLFVRLTSRGDEAYCDRNWHHPECDACAPAAPCVVHKPMSRTFVPGDMAPQLRGTEYEANLDRLDPIERAQKKFGDWMIKPASGKVFQRANIPIVPVAPADVRFRVRFWDRAGTEGAGDWTAGVRMAALESGLWCVEHVVREQLGPGNVAQLIASTAATDPAGTIIGIEQDPGQAGKFEAHFYVSALAGYTVKILPTQGESKIARAGPLAAQSAVKNVVCVQGAWNQEFVTELNDFPDGTFDDQVDAASGAFRLLVPLVRAHSKKGAGIGGVRVRVL